MTVTIERPGYWIPIEEPTTAVTAVVEPQPCPPWCVNDEIDPADGTVRHGGAEGIVLFRDETDKEHQLYVALSRWDDPDGSIVEQQAVSVVFDGDGFDMTPAAATELGRVIAQVGAAGTTGPNFVEVEAIKLDDEIHVGDEWQTVTLLVHDGRRREVAVYTVSEEDEVLRVSLGTLVEVRHGADLVYVTDTKFDTKEVGQDGSH